MQCHAFKTCLYPEPRTFSTRIPIQFFQYEVSCYTHTYVQAFQVSSIVQGFPPKSSVLNPVPDGPHAPPMSSSLILSSVQLAHQNNGKYETVYTFSKFRIVTDLHLGIISLQACGRHVHLLCESQCTIYYRTKQTHLHSASDFMLLLWCMPLS